jgi:hypothetical protein
MLVLIEFPIFDAVRVAGFLADTATVHALRHSLGLNGAGAVAYGVAATVTWMALAFRGKGREGQPTANGHAFRFVLNRGTYAALVTFVPACAAEPVWAVAAGAIAGMFLNISLSRSLVFH